ncbi:hypothetical protein LG301_06095 [Vreelandella venusta]|uniref:hypothetical protein n=1 Tax=Vreelandella venusta TaxID=44935 RepID=UPI00384E4D58
MDKTWLDVIKVTGAVGVIAFLAHLVISHVYSEEIIELFGSDRMFGLTILIVAAVFFVLLMAVLKQKDKTVRRSEESEVDEDDKEKDYKGPKVTYRNRAKHNGDNNF